MIFLLPWFYVQKRSKSWKTGQRLHTKMQKPLKIAFQNQKLAQLWKFARTASEPFPISVWMYCSWHLTVVHQVGGRRGPSSERNLHWKSSNPSNRDNSCQNKTNGARKLKIYHSKFASENGQGDDVSTQSSCFQHFANQINKTKSIYLY